MSAPQYQLAFTLHGHASDVRNLCSPSPHIPLLLSASRDGSAIVWGPSGRDGEGSEWDVKLRVEGPEKRFVSCVGMTRWNGEAYLLVGSSSGVLSTFVLPSATAPPQSTNGPGPDPYHTLVEHKQNLCCIDTSKGGLIASGRRRTVLVWKDFKVVLRLEAHQQAVWAVRFVGEDRTMLAAADNKIFLHSIDIASGSSTVLQEYTGHSQPVRGLSLTSDTKGFWSCANDSLVNVYSFDKPSPLRSLSGHTSFVYSVNTFPDGSGAVSSGEDGTLRVWSNTELIQTLPHTSNSLWSSSIVPSASGSSHYIVSSSQDAQIRFFTRSADLMAPESVRERWNQEISSRALDKSQVGDVKQADLPGLEALGREGKKEGQVLMLKNEGSVEAYSWSMASKSWQKVGTVVDAIGSGRKQLFNGVEYDYVFDVDVSEGMPPLKLPYNISENPWVAAQKFLEKNDLPNSYVDQVVQFIEKNTGGVQLGQGDATSYVDPYTGAARYTGSSSQGGSSSGNADPFTGSSSYSSAPSSTSASKPKGALPVTAYLSFKQINVNAARTKISQLNDELKAGSPEQAIPAEDEKNLVEIFAFLSQPTVALPNPDKSSAGETFSSERYLDLVSRWPEDKRFPLIDIARCLAALSPAFGTCSTAPSKLLESCDWSSPWSASKSRETNTLLALRALVNMFLTANGRRTMGQSAEQVLVALRERKWDDLGARKLPFVTVLLSYSSMAVKGGFPALQAGALLELITFVLEHESEDAETVYRASVALGNMLCAPSVAGSLQIGAVQRGQKLVKERATSIGEKRLKDLSTEISSLSG
ncbi:PLAA family ubiquitin binding-domain-containing protein [Kockovaella imperatae]|uniref:PLAA family ubiquitin binding-domain-containing protein n=1 Tax=Kockovaella imperatae TaxID=4999 RepID=A0A1Y1UC50_9TREE|nr:PLAA family ubiquitin binding-domain-containing protein [Kockovaella imperatae]ORX35613.1 PLAA family ubiquitin binding-domain-containing protein [Kockovaella imperatae]